ncbi:MAG: citrate transporter, partial [Firmicutes bacterium]|nr:citrate transporter [Bacillota bacterium]
MIAQAAALIIFVGMFVLIILDKFERQWITLVSGLLMLIVVFGICLHSPQAIVDTLNLKAFFAKSFWYGGEESASAGINWSTIVFIAGMMIMVEGLGHSGFFRWLCLSLAKAVHYHLVPLLICFMCMSGFLSMFIDSITVVLFLATVTIELSRMLKYNPVPMILAEIFCANLGGAATMSGDPPNIIIGTSLGYTFMDFISNTGAVVGISFLFALVYFWLCFRKELKANEAARVGEVSCPEPSTAIESKPAFLG